MTLNAFRARLLAARDARAAAITRLAGTLPHGYSLVFLSLNVPGEHKHSRRLDDLFNESLVAVLNQAPGASVAAEGRDALGPWAALSWNAAPAIVKRGCVALEEALAGGRLVDLDVFDLAGQQVGRQALRLPPRRCLVCGEAAVDCIRVQRHGAWEVRAAVNQLLS